MSAPKTMRELRALYPYQFQRGETSIGVDVAVGWFEKFALLCDEIDRRLGPDKHGFYWAQIKEKFGSARAHFRLSEMPSEDDLEEQDISEIRAMVDSNGKPLYPDLPPERTPQELRRLREKHEALKPLQLELRKLVNAFVQWSNTACLFCGEPGELDQSEPYIMVLCPKHTAERKAGMLEVGQLWME